MSTIIIYKNIRIPIYKQIVRSVLESVENGAMGKGDALPSINRLAREYSIAKETVIKAYKELQSKGIISSIKGKGFFVNTNEVILGRRVFLLFDTFTSYKETLYRSIKMGLEEGTYIDIFFHHFNINVFRRLISEAVGNYTSYLILAFDHKEINNVLKDIPDDKIVLIDRKSRFISIDYPAVYQDFYRDIIQILFKIKSQIAKYKSLNLIFRNSITEVPEELRKGFEYFCQKNSINYSVFYDVSTFIPKKGDSYIVIDDDDLVFLIEYAIQKNMTIGKDIGIISYNDTSLKKVVSGGISVISTDFLEMGKKVADMLITGKYDSIANNSFYIDRGSF